MRFYYVSFLNQCVSNFLKIKEKKKRFSIDLIKKFRLNINIKTWPLFLFIILVYWIYRFEKKRNQKSLIYFISFIHLTLLLIRVKLYYIPFLPFFLENNELDSPEFLCNKNISFHYYYKWHLKCLTIYLLLYQEKKNYKTSKYINTDILI